MKPRPITRQRSPWERMGTLPIADGYSADLQCRRVADGYSADLQCRRVADGTLRALVGLEPKGWHLSISFVNHKGEPTRYPTWDEIAHARQELLPATLGFVMHLPPADEYVALHDTTFHLHQHPPRTSDGSPSATGDGAS